MKRVSSKNGRNFMLDLRHLSVQAILRCISQAKAYRNSYSHFYRQIKARSDVPSMVPKQARPAREANRAPKIFQPVFATADPTHPVQQQLQQLSRKEAQRLPAVQPNNLPKYSHRPKRLNTVSRTMIGLH